jgi:signal transduction histidine kinase
MDVNTTERYSERSRALGDTWRRQRLRSYVVASVIGGGLTLWIRWPGLAVATALCILATAAIVLRGGRERHLPTAVAADAALVAAILTVMAAPPAAIAFYAGYYVVAAMLLTPRSVLPLSVAIGALGLGILVVPELAGVAVSPAATTLIGATSAVVFSLNVAVLLFAVDRQVQTLDRVTIRRVGFSEAVAESARHLLSDAGDGALDATMNALAEALDADSVFVESNVDDPVHGPCTVLVAWCDLDYEDPDPPERWQLQPWSSYPMAHERLAAGEHFHFRVDDLEGVEREMYAGTGIGSEIDVPIFAGDRWMGIIGVSDADPEYTWSDEDVSLLRSLADMIGVHWLRREEAATRQRLIDSLDERFRYERAMAACSRALLRGVDGGIEEGLAELIEATGADFAFVDVNVEHDELGLCAALVAEAVRPGYEGEIKADGWQDHTLDHPIEDLIPYSSLPTVHAALSRGEVAHIITDELEAGVEHEIYERGGVLSELCIPFFVAGEWHGSVGFTQFTTKRAWGDRELEVLRTAAEMFGVAFERQAVRSRLEALLESKDELIAGVSHELRTPLTVVVGLSDELANGEDFESSEARALMRMVATQSREMADIVEDLLVAARTDDGSVAVVPESVDLMALSETVASYVSLPASRTLTIEGEATEAWADPGRVRQIVRNLITNAIRYGGDSIAVRIGGSASAVLEVVDDGPGVPEDSVVTVFEPYQRAHNRPTQPSSVGLGLTLSRRLAHLMGGDLEYAPRDGLCVFRLTLPRPARSGAEHGLKPEVVGASRSSE